MLEKQCFDFLKIRCSGTRLTLGTRATQEGWQGLLHAPGSKGMPNTDKDNKDTQWDEGLEVSCPENIVSCIVECTDPLVGKGFPSVRGADVPPDDLPET